MTTTATATNAFSLAIQAAATLTPDERATLAAHILDGLPHAAAPVEAVPILGAARLSAALQIRPNPAPDSARRQTCGGANRTHFAAVTAPSLCPDRPQQAAELAALETARGAGIARGSQQESALAAGSASIYQGLKGKAKDYQNKYISSADNLTDRAKAKGFILPAQGSIQFARPPLAPEPCAQAKSTPDTCPKAKRPPKCKTAPKNLREWPFVFASQPLWIAFEPSKVRCWLKTARRAACDSSAWQGLHDLECVLGWVKTREDAPQVCFVAAHELAALGQNVLVWEALDVLRAVFEAEGAELPRQITDPAEIAAAAASGELSAMLQYIAQAPQVCPRNPQ